MAGTVMKPVGFPGTVDMSNTTTPSLSHYNSYRISAVTNRLLVHLQGDTNTNNTEFSNLCLSLARGIDYAVTNNEIPGSAPELPYLLKQVCQRKNDLQLQASVMVLMISVKSACSNGWFSEKEKEELHALSDEMQSSFCSVSVKDMNSNMKNKGSNFHDTISTVMSRFYPGMKMVEILAAIETSPGYDSYVTDLHISKSARSPEDKIYLFVTQTDNIETSSCIISPQQVSILLNGEGVERRTCVYKDPGPQIPTLVTHMLKYGSNLLQVVGQFTGKYIIVIAFMNVVSNPSSPSIPDYVPPAAAQPDSDNEIVEGPSRVSLKCPISFSRIKIPVKGHSCKHLQCFDFNNYVGINSRRPQWRCPHCSQSVCYTDIRIDQIMVKVLKEVAEDISHVKIFSDGSWEAVAESNENSEKTKDKDTPLLSQETPIQKADDIMDLTEADYNEVETTDIDKKPNPVVMNSGPQVPPHMEDGFWREFYSSSFSTRTVNAIARSDNNNETCPVRDAFTSLDREIEDFQRNNLILGQSQSQTARLPTPANYVTRTPVAVQALPAQHSSRTGEFARSHPNQHQASPLNSSSQQTASQNQGHRDHPHLLSQTSPQLGSRSAPPLNRSDRFQQQSLNQRTPTPIRPAGHPHYSMAAIQRANHQHLNRTPPPIQTSVPMGDQRGGSVDEQNWRPTGRMRGSLSGRAYTDALNQFIIHPNQPVQAARPPVLNTPRPFIPPHLQVLMGNNFKSRSPSPGARGQDGSMADN